MVFHTEVNGSLFLLKIESREVGAHRVQPYGFVQTILRITGSLRLRGGRRPDSVVVRDRTWRQKLGLLCLNDHGMLFFRSRGSILGSVCAKLTQEATKAKSAQSSEGAILT